MDWDIWNQQYGKEQIQKWRNGIDLRITTDSEIQEYTSTKLYKYMECDYDSYRASNNIWVFFYKDFNYFTTKDFDQLRQYYLKKLRKHVRYFKVYIVQDYKDLTIAQSLVNITKEEIYCPWTEENAKALLIKALPIEALLIGKALSIKAPPVDTNKPAILVETDKPAIPFANTTELSVEDIHTFNTTLISPQSIPFTSSCLAYTLTSPHSIPGTGFGQFHTLQHTNRSLQRTNGSVTHTHTSAGFESQASQYTGVG
jgi:hypothetical protein